MIRINPEQYFENQNQENKNYLPWLIFGGICIVAIAAMVIAYSRK